MAALDGISCSPIVAAAACHLQRDMGIVRAGLPNRCSAVFLNEAYTVHFTVAFGCCWIEDAPPMVTSVAERPLSKWLALAT